MARAYLQLEDRSILEGESFGFRGETSGEVVFTTAMTGYPESLTDPSFTGQILTFTYPLMGNYGIPKLLYDQKHLVKNFESEHVSVRGVIVSSYADIPSHYQSIVSLSDWLKSQKIPGICGIDTRFLTQKLRESGVMAGKILLHPQKTPVKTLQSDGFVKIVSCSETISYTPEKPNGKHIVLVDCGVKHGILRALLARGYRVTQVPWDTDPLSVSHIDGVVVSNGPGDPKDCRITINNIKTVLTKRIPFLGICLGHQLLALAIGADTYKLRYGHRGINQPCLERHTNRAYVTSQNHGYAVHRDTIPKGFDEWFMNLNDNTNEGLINESKKIWSVQFHPEGNPGPFDTDWIFNLL